MRTDLKIIILSIIEKSKDYYELSDLVKEIQDLINNKLLQEKEILDLSDKYNSIYKIVKNLIEAGYIEGKREIGLPPLLKLRIKENGIRFLEINRMLLFPQEEIIIKNQENLVNKQSETSLEVDFDEIEEIGAEIYDIVSNFDINPETSQKLIEKFQKFVVGKINDKIRSFE